MADMPIGLYRLDVSKGAKLVLSYLWRYAGRERFVWVDRETIAGDLGIESERTLRRHLGELRKAGVIAEDVQVRMGKARPGWWLRDRGDVDLREGVVRDVGGGSGVEAHGEVEQITARDGPEVESEGVVPAGIGREPRASGAEGSEVRWESGQNWPAPDKDGRERPRLAGIPDKNDRARPELAGIPAKIDRGRTRLAGIPAKTGRPIPIELPGTKHLCDPAINVGATSGAGGGRKQDRVRAGLDLLRRWRVHGGDPEGLGPWPSPTTPKGLELPQLPMGAKLGELLQEERTPEEIHRAVHLVAELVEAGILPADKWRATYVFSGWLEELVVKGLELRAKRAWEQGQRDVAHWPAVSAGVDEALSREAMLQTLAESVTLRPVADSPPALPAKRTRPKPVREDYLELLDLRSQVEAMAAQLGRDQAEVLSALGRSSMRELEVGDRERLPGVFAALQDGEALPDCLTGARSRDIP